MKFLSAFVLLVLPLAVFSFQCFDEKGAADWMLMLKYPGSVSKKGMQYAYISSNNQTSTFTESKASLMDEESPLWMVLNQFDKEDMSEDTAYVAWNSQISEKTVSLTYAHAKGFMALNKTDGTGFLLFHSVPKFPIFETGSDKISHKMLDETYGQDFLCLTINKDTFQNVLRNLIIAKAYFYRTKVPDTMLSTAVKAAEKLVKGMDKKDRSNGFKLEPTLPFKMPKGQAITIFTSTRYVDNHLFDDIVQPALNCSMQVESWGRPYMKNVCDKSLKTMNIKTIKIKDGVQWSTTQDHSKWGVSTDDERPWLCISDMNRMDSQAKRGGLAICIKSKKVQEAFRAIVNTYDDCEGEHKEESDDEEETEESTE